MSTVAATMNAARQAVMDTERANRLEDIRWMMTARIDETEVARRLGISTDSLWAWCQRNGHIEDVWNPLTAYRATEWRVATDKKDTAA